MSTDRFEAYRAHRAAGLDPYPAAKKAKYKVTPQAVYKLELRLKAATSTPPDGPPCASTPRPASDLPSYIAALPPHLQETYRRNISNRLIGDLLQPAADDRPGDLEEFLDDLYVLDNMPGDFRQRYWSSAPRVNGDTISPREWIGQLALSGGVDVNDLLP
jgi:hypothetical protein